MPRIEHWTLVNADGTTAERFDATRAQKLWGTVYGHTQHPDGKEVRTSAIVAASKDAVTTQSGQVYELGATNAGYLAWLGDRPLPFGGALQLVAPHELAGVRVWP